MGAISYNLQDESRHQDYDEVPVSKATKIVAQLLIR